MPSFIAMKLNMCGQLPMFINVLHSQTLCGLGVTNYNCSIMAPKQQLEKSAWAWAETTRPDFITEDCIETAYRLKLKPCELNYCRWVIKISLLVCNSWYGAMEVLLIMIMIICLITVRLHLSNLHFVENMHCMFTEEHHVTFEAA
jgi:hypothetical protein